MWWRLWGGVGVVDDWVVNSAHGQDNSSGFPNKAIPRSLALLEIEALNLSQIQANSSPP
jgi:hypothetical protein